MPYSDSNENYQVINANTGLLLLNITKDSPTTLSGKGDLSGFPVYIGQTYQFEYEFNTWYLRNQNGDVLRNGRLQVRTVTLSFTDTGLFRYQLKQPRREWQTQTWMPKTIGASFIGRAEIASGTARFSALGENKKIRIRLVNESHLPCEFQSITFEGFYVSRARPV